MLPFLVGGQREDGILGRGFGMVRIKAVVVMGEGGKCARSSWPAITGQGSRRARTNIPFLGLGTFGGGVHRQTPVPMSKGRGLAVPGVVRLRCSSLGRLASSVLMDAARFLGMGRRGESDDPVVSGGGEVGDGGPAGTVVVAEEEDDETEEADEKGAPAAEVGEVSETRGLASVSSLVATAVAAPDTPDTPAGLAAMAMAERVRGLVGAEW